MYLKSPWPASETDDLWHCELCSRSWCSICRPEGRQWCENCQFWHCIECSNDFPCKNGWLGGDFHIESDCPDPEEYSGFLHWPRWKESLKFVKPYCTAMRYASATCLHKIFSAKSVGLPLQLLKRIVLAAVPFTDEVKTISTRRDLQRRAEKATTVRHGPMNVLAGKQRARVKGLKGKYKQYNRKEGVIQDWNADKSMYLLKVDYGRKILSLIHI